MKKALSFATMALCLAGACFVLSFKSSATKTVHMKENGKWISIIDTNGDNIADYTLAHAPYSGNVGGLYQKSTPTPAEQAYFAKN